MAAGASSGRVCCSKRKSGSGARVVKKRALGDWACFEELQGSMAGLGSEGRGS